jgi:hypothetical protein
MLLLRSDSLSLGKTRTIRITEGKRIYELILRVLARERIRLNGESLPTLRLAVRYRALDGSVSSEEDGIRSTTLWVSDDEEHTILRVEAESPLGLFFGERSVRARRPRPLEIPCGQPIEPPSGFVRLRPPHKTPTLRTFRMNGWQAAAAHAGPKSMPEENGPRWAFC